MNGMKEHFLTSQGIRRPDNTGLDASHTVAPLRNEIAPDQKTPDGVRQWSRQIFEKIYTRDPGIPKFYLEREIALLVNDTNAYEQGLITPAQCQGASEFLDELVRFIEDKVRREDEGEILQAFLENIQNRFFHGHPNIATSLPAGELLIIAARATRISQARGWLGSELVEQLGFKLNFADAGVSESIVQTLENQPIETVLDIIDQLQIVAANSLASYSSGEHGFDHAKSIINSLKKAYVSPLVEYYGELAINRIDKETANPSLSIISREGDPLQGRIAQSFSEIDQKKFLQLRNQINPLKPTPYGSKFLPIASDALGLYDRSNLFCSIASIDFSQLPPEQSVSMVDMRHFESALKDPHYTKKINACKEIIGYVNERVILPSQVNPDLPNVWHGISTVLDEEEWRVLFSGNSVLQDIHNRLEEFFAQTHREANERSEHVADRFMEKLRSIDMTSLQFLTSQQQEYFTGIFDDFRNAHENQKLELAFRHANKFTSGLQWIADDMIEKTGRCPDSLTTILDWMETMNTAQEQIWKEAQEARDTFQNNLGKDSVTVKNENNYGNIVWMLNTNHERLALDILAYLEQREQEIKDAYTPVDFIDLDKLSQDGASNVFGINSQKGSPLLLQHLHRPDMRHLIEEKLGISLTHLGIHAQVAFLEYLSSTDKQDFERLSAFLSRYDLNDRVAIASSFLAFRHQPDFSYIIERVCQHEGVGLPLVRYVSAMIGNVESIRRLLTEQFRQPEQNEDIVRIHNRLIDKAYDILLRYNTKIADLETIQELEHGQQLLDDLEFDASDDFQDLRGGGVEKGSYAVEKERLAKEIQNECNGFSLSLTLFLNTFKTLRESGVPFSLEDVKGLDWQTALSPEQLAEADRKEMRTIYTANYPDSADYSATFRETLIHGLDASFRKEGARFYTLKKDGALIAFARFEDLPPAADGTPRKYFGSFNVAPEMRGSKIGDVFLETTLKKEREGDWIIEASADPRIKISQHYIEKDDFVATGIEMLADRPLLHIRYDASLNERLTTKRTTSLHQDPTVLEKVSAGEALHTKTSTGKPIDFSPLENGYVLTRFFESKEHTVCVFEKPSQEETSEMLPKAA